jgi:hypothetical protein
MRIAFLGPLVSLSVSLTLANSVEAAVIINEVAWMGSVTSANHEWIELYNSGSGTESLDGWVLTDGANLTISLTGSLGGGGYAVLERTSEASAPGTALLTYTGALVNTGATLTLRRADGQVEDQVAGGADWSTIGGDNVTKATAQYTVSGWRTGTPTPGGVNTATAVVEEETDDDTTEVVDDTEVVTESPTQNETTGSVTTERTSSSRGKATPIVPATTELTVAITAQEIAYVNQAVTFTAVPKGIGKTITASLEHVWNFGDLSTASGTKAIHTFKRAGTYIVTHRAYFGRHDVVARREITVLPVTLALSFDPDGELLLHNNAAYDIDVSGYRIVAGGEERTFPPYSLVMAKQTLSLPFIKAKQPVVSLEDNRGAVVARTNETPLVLEPPLPTPLAVASGYQMVPAPAPVRTISSEGRDTPVIKTLSEEVLVSTTPAVASVSAASETPSARWTYGLLGVLLLAIIGMLLYPTVRTYRS